MGHKGIFDNGTSAADKGLTVTEDTAFYTNRPWSVYTVRFKTPFTEENWVRTPH